MSEWRAPGFEQASQPDMEGHNLKAHPIYFFFSYFISFLFFFFLKGGERFVFMFFHDDAYNNARGPRPAPLFFYLHDTIYVCMYLRRAACVSRFIISVALVARPIYFNLCD